MVKGGRKRKPRATPRHVQGASGSPPQTFGSAGGMASRTEKDCRSTYGAS